MAYVFEKYSAGGGTGNGFIVIPISLINGESGDVTLPDGVTLDDIMSNPARVVVYESGLTVFLAYSGLGGDSTHGRFAKYEASVEVEGGNNSRFVCKLFEDGTYSIGQSVDSGSSGGTGDGFIVMPLDMTTEEGTLTFPDGVTADDMMANPARFVFWTDAFGLIVLTFKKVVITNFGTTNDGYLLYQGDMYMEGSSGGVAVSLKVYLDTTYKISTLSTQGETTILDVDVADDGSVTLTEEQYTVVDNNFAYTTIDFYDKHLGEQGIATQLHYTAKIIGVSDRHYSATIAEGESVVFLNLIIRPTEKTCTYTKKVLAIATE